MAAYRKYERDIDVLLAEEFTVSPAFAAWFLAHTRFSDANAQVLDVYVSRSDSTGESDLVVVFEEIGGDSRFALLIEDKIDAPLQPEQEARYRLRAQAEMLRGDYSECEVILCSPAAYPAVRPKAASFDRFVSYESISRFLAVYDPTPRGAYRANFLATAAARSVNSWVKVEDDTTTAFWTAAYESAVREFPILEMKKPNFTKDSTWINFRPQDMPTSPQHTYISCKGDRGFVDLTFAGSLAPQFASSVALVLDPDMTVHQTGKSAAIRITVEGFQVLEPWETAQLKIKAAFGACERLIKFYRQHRQALALAASASSSSH